MSGLGAGSCDTSKSQLGRDGLCYAYCPDGWSPIDNGPTCAKNCPSGFATCTPTSDSTLACAKPSFTREVKPMLSCPADAERQYTTCYLGCPTGTSQVYNLCVPQCPAGFVQTADGLSCQAEYIKRVATVREACYANETRIEGRTCLSPCPAGAVPLPSNIEFCYATVPVNLRPYFWTGDRNFGRGVTDDVGPVVAKVIFPRKHQPAMCDPLFEPLNGNCFSRCPVGSSPLGTECVVNCPSGFKSVNNQSACLRPTRTRLVVVRPTAAFAAAIRKIVLVILIIMGFAFVSSLVK